MPTTFGVLHPPLGLHRLKLVEFVFALVCAKYKCLLDALLCSRIIPGILDLFFCFPWNSLLHKLVQDMVLTILRGTHEEAKLHVILTLSG